MTQRFTRYLALGDSFTEGLCDVREDGTYRGWADLVAHRLAAEQPIQYANLGVRGRKLAQVIAEQVPFAEQSGADLVTVAAGGNDILRWSSDIPGLGEAYDAMLGRLTATGAVVVVFAGFDPRVRIPFTATPGRRAAALNSRIRDSAARHSARLVDLWSLPRIYEDRMWAPDRLHLGTDGHALVAASVLTALGRPTEFDDLEHGAAPKPRSRAVDAVDRARWFAVDVVPWAYRGIRGRSSGDGRLPKHPDFVDLG